jgi:ubiquinone/menaquinone biosynthesis C-methylase UbiE
MTADETQRRYFEHADPDRFRWVTQADGLAGLEDELLASLLAGLAPPALEVGCGEGGNLVRLRRQGWCAGVDASVAKVAFAAHHVRGAHLAAADAMALPFRAASFRSLLVRDLLHHVPAPERVLAETVRVLAPGGRLVLLEPNGGSPLIRLFARLVPAEAEARRFGAARVRGLLSGLPLVRLEVRAAEPLPLRRLVFHYRFGLPALGRLRALHAGLAWLEPRLGRLVPAARWTYVVATAERA